MTDFIAGGAVRRTRHRRAWVRIFFGGLLLWLASVVVTFITQNPNLLPTVILLGSFLVPVTFVAYAFEHRATDTLAEHTIFVGFVYGGVLGVLGASVLEAPFAGNQSLLTYLFVGLVEEGVKLVALWWIARRLPRFITRDGIVLGATVGFGFAAFESAGYSLNALFTVHGLSLGNLVETQVLRGVLAPVGHGLWTGVLGGVLFHTARHGRLRLFSGSVALWYLVVSLLHAFWDASGGIAALIAVLITVNSMKGQLFGAGQVPQPTELQVQVYTAFSWGFLVLDAVVGLLLLFVWWRRGAV